MEHEGGRLRESTGGKCTFHYMLPTLLTILGTRPEVIKMSPVLRLLQKNSSIESKVCVTSQQQRLLPQAIAHFRIGVDFALELPEPDHPLLSAVSNALTALDGVMEKCQPDLVLVQGDTTSALAGALAASYRQIPVGHIEAGLRTGDLSAPFPEEINRQMISRIAQYHFATTTGARDNLLSEGIKGENIWLTGSPIVDALLHALAAIKNQPQANWLENIPANLLVRIEDPHRPLILVTGHRRENLDSGIASVCRSITQLADRHRNWDFVFPVHPNPAVGASVGSALGSRENIFLTPPMNYTEFIFTMARASLIITDSGGIQEEAPYLNVPLLVTRDCTERTEGIALGVAQIVGSHPRRLVDAAERTIAVNRQPLAQCSHFTGLYGDGKASWRLRDLIVGIMSTASDRAIAV